MGVGGEIRREAIDGEYKNLGSSLSEKEKRGGAGLVGLN